MLHSLKSSILSHRSIASVCAAVEKLFTYQTANSTWKICISKLLSTCKIGGTCSQLFVRACNYHGVEKWRDQDSVPQWSEAISSTAQKRGEGMSAPRMAQVWVVRPALYHIKAQPHTGVTARAQWHCLHTPCGGPNPHPTLHTLSKTFLTESQNELSWKSSLRSSGPTYDPKSPCQPDQGLERHVQSSLKQL